MEKLTFDAMYKKLCKKLRVPLKNQTNEEHNILDNDIEYKKHKEQIDREKLKKEREVQTYEKKYNNVIYGAYFFKCVISDLEIDEKYRPNIVEKIYYETSMIATKQNEDGDYSIENILAMKNSNRDKVIERYNYIVDLLNNKSEEELLKIISQEIDNL